jgi:hypothetical protein
LRDDEVFIINSTKEEIDFSSHIRFSTDLYLKYKELAPLIRSRYFEEIEHEGKFGIIINRVLSNELHESLNTFISSPILCLPYCEAR